MHERNKINIEVVVRLLLPYVMLIINGSVYGNVHHTNYLTCAYFVCMLLLHKNRISYEIKQNYIMTGLYNGVIVVGFLVVLASMINFKFSDTFLFIVLFSTVLLYADIDQYLVELNISTNIMLIGSGLILVGYYSGKIFGQWNPNQIAMITVSSVFFAFISWDNSKHKMIKALLVIITVYGVWKTESRAMMVGILASILVMWAFSKRLFLKNNTLASVAINAIAIIPFLVLIWNMYYIDSEFSAILNNIFSRYTWKTVYSGREDIWTQWIPVMMQPKYLLIGTGEKVVGNLHSLIVDIWYSFGAVTMLVFIHIMFSAYKKMLHMFDDRFVRTCFASFCGMYVAQAFECMSSDTTYFYVFMYSFLAMAIGRCMTIEFEERELG